MSKVLVTGIAGFIGSELARQLLRAGFEVVGLDNLNDYYAPALKQHRLASLARDFKYEFQPVDIEDKMALEAVFKAHRFTTVFNLAARAGVGYSLINPEIYWTTNLMGTLNLLQLMVRFQVPKIVLASTSSVYAGEALPFREDAPVNHPISPYSASKKAAEQICYTYHYHYGISCSVVRYFTVYGPAGRPDMSILRFIRWIDEGVPLELYGDGSQSRDFTFVEDIARGTQLAAATAGFEIINLGGGREPIALNAMISYIAKKLGKTPRLNFHPALKADIKETRADIQKAKTLLQWQPETEFWSGLDQTIAWHLANREMVLGLDLKV